MEEGSDRPDVPLGRTADDGRRASVAQLRRFLPSSPPPFLEGAMDNPGMGRIELALILRNRQTGAALLERIARDRRWVAAYEIQRLLVFHPNAPLTLVRKLTPKLYWKDLAEACDHQRLQPATRRRAEEVLLARVRDLTVGERITLARRASRGVISVLLEGEEPRVIQSLLSNRRLVEAEAERIASNHSASVQLLGQLAVHQWGECRSVRMALLRNPRTPIAAALRLVRRLHPRDLPQLTNREEVPAIVRMAAARELERSDGSDSAGSANSTRG
jgi:hypothetical protein